MLKFIALRSYQTCVCEDHNCKYDFGCGSIMTVEEYPSRELENGFVRYELHDAGKALDLVNNLRDVNVGSEPVNSAESIEDFLGQLIVSKCEKVLYIDQGEERTIVFPIVEGYKSLLLTHPNKIVRQLLIDNLEESETAPLPTYVCP